MQKEKAEEILQRLTRFSQLERQATDEVGWIALAYSVSRSKADKMITEARSNIDQTQTD